MGANFRFFNYRDEAVELVVEPWADSEIVSPGRRVDFDLEGDNAAIEFSWDEEPVIFVWADVITMTSDSRRVCWRQAPDYVGKPPFCRWHGNPGEWDALPDPDGES